MIDLTDDLQVFAATLRGEAAGEGKLGEVDVALVVRARVLFARSHERHQFGDGSFAACCEANWQFSCWKPAPIGTREKLLALDFLYPDANLVECVDIARAAIDGTLEDPTGGLLTNPAAPATFYKRVDCQWPADWGPVVPALFVYKHHEFYHLA